MVQARPYSKAFYGLHIFYSIFSLISRLGQTHDRRGGANRYFSALESTFSLSDATHHRGEGGLCRGFALSWTNSPPRKETGFYYFIDSAHINSSIPHFSFMDSTNSLFELHILLMDMPWTPQILVFNYTFGFMNSTKVLVSTLRISPGLGPNGQAADIATELS